MQIKVERSNRILAELEKFQPDSKQMQSALFVIGNLIANRGKLNLKTATPPAFDSGFLHGKIAFRIEGSGKEIQRVVCGAFGVKYARMVEYGGVMTKRQLAAMFASFNETGKKRRAGKGIIANRRYRGRPYLTTALEQVRPQVLAALANIRKA